MRSKLLDDNGAVIFSEGIVAACTSPDGIARISGFLWEVADEDSYVAVMFAKHDGAAIMEER